jgi:hypothetical protein
MTTNSESDFWVLKVNSIMFQADGDDDESSNSVSNFVGLIEGEEYGPGLVGPAGLYMSL